jgi:prepilin-type N-terminal cleavage/methylation domain-containing protein
MRCAAGSPGRLDGLRSRLRAVRSEDGFTLVELLVVIVLMGLILGPLVDSLVTALNAQAQQVNVVNAQEQARLALERMRKDIHCAHSVNPPVANGSGGVTLILNETNTTGIAECPGLIQQNSSSVQWCTIPVAGATNRYQLYRENDPNKNCDGVDSTFQVDYITESALWSIPSCTTGDFPTVAVTLPVDVNVGSLDSSSYDLQDQIALRNASPC